VSTPGRNDWGTVGGGYSRVSAKGWPEKGWPEKGWPEKGWPERKIDPADRMPVPREPGISDTRIVRDPASADSSSRSLVRPYAVTGGRTQPRTQLQIEAMVTASHYEARDLPALSPECQVILGFCRDWRSVAEISAVLRMPLGVARVLIADMAVEGLVRIHQTDHAHGRPDLNLLERVLSGLRKL
jgi:hypothetical protein